MTMIMTMPYGCDDSLYDDGFSHVYGEYIIVPRVVTQSTSTYKLKDQNGKNIVEKKVKEGFCPTPP
jgi:hypothetical protein